MPRRRSSETAERAAAKLKAMLKSGFDSGMFLAGHKSDMLVRAAYLRGVSDCIDILQKEIDSESIPGKSIK